MPKLGGGGLVDGFRYGDQRQVVERARHRKHRSTAASIARRWFQAGDADYFPALQTAFLLEIGLL